MVVDQDAAIHPNDPLSDHIRDAERRVWRVDLNEECSRSRRPEGRAIAAFTPASGQHNQHE
jgi:hypothetical protein